MEALKKQRTVQRSAFTRAYTTFTSKMKDNAANIDEKNISFQILEIKMQELQQIQTQYNNKLCESDASEDTILADIDTDDEYKVKFLSAKNLISKLSTANSIPAASVTPITVNNVKSSTSQNDALKFQGTVRDWLPFWNQFKRFHNDTSISKEDKFARLINATIPGTRAHDIVMSYPLSSENYDKAIQSLTDRFGRNELLVECYMRELLGLVLQNALKGSGKSSLSLSTLYDKLETYVNSLESLGVGPEKSAAILYPFVESAISEEILRAWQRTDKSAAADNDGNCNTKDLLMQLIKFLRTEVRSEERIEMARAGFGIPSDRDNTKKHQNKGKPSERSSEKFNNSPSASALLTTEKTVSCIFCNMNNHVSRDCLKARKLSIIERKDKLKQAGGCYRCLTRGHLSNSCDENIKCQWCGKRHYLLMCENFDNDANKSSTCEKTSESKKKFSKPHSKTEQKPLNENNLMTVSFCEMPTVCLQTLRVNLYSDSKIITVRAILDTAAHRSYIRAEVANKLGYKSIGEREFSHTLFGGVKSTPEVHNICTIRMQDLNGTYACSFQAFIQKSICDTVSTIPNDTWVNVLRKKHNVVLSDIDSVMCEKPIDVLIGADVAGKIMTGKKIELENGLCVFETLLGWTVMGKLPTAHPKQTNSTMLVMFARDEAPLSDLWRLDVLGITDPIEKLSKAAKDEKTREFLTQTTTTNVENRYVVKLPWAESHSLLPSNYDIALSRLGSTVKRLETRKIFDAYNHVFDDWLKAGIIERVPDSEIHDAGHYLPHRPVIKEHSTTKIRPVFDASAHMNGYCSLNQCLEKGPNLIELLPTILNRFREYAIGVVSDIKKAFLQIAIDKEDCNFLRFLWVLNNEIIVFRHLRLVFGLACSPFILAAVLALHFYSCLNKCKKETEKAWKISTVEKLRNSFYVDNCVTSIDTEEDLNDFIKESTAIMEAGRFELHEWESSINTTPNDSLNVLGVNWFKKADVLLLNPSIFEFDMPLVITKRNVLSFANRIFDPIGVTSPVSLLPKLVLQTLWESKLTWDNEINVEESSKIVFWLNELRFLKHIEIPRYLGKGRLTLHAFGDASNHAFATVIFSRVEGDDGKVTVSLLNSKSRIAPKQKTIPRLELMAATITARLVATLVEGFTRNIENIYYWTDSTTVLAWIKRDAPWNVFVRNRVKEIRALTPTIDNWRHIPGDSNPADLPSRGCSPKQLLQSEWWKGPNWLYLRECEWPKSQQTFNDEEINAECKKSAQLVNIEKEIIKFDFSYYFSSYTKIIRFSAWLHRFLKNRKAIINAKKDKSRIGYEKRPYISQSDIKKLTLTVQEIKDAENKLLVHLQREMFSDLNKKKLAPFKTYVDKNDLIILKTKILNRKDTPNFLCPILLDNDHEIIYLIVKEMHEKLGHVGALTIMSELRERFWIISVRKVIKNVMKNCISCKIQKSKHLDCETPPLPLDRVRDAMVFETVGVDFAGPVYLQKGEKAWICIFTCAVYRAVHLELASGLSVEAFLECLRRFIARRGRPSAAYTDCGTNFKGTHNAFSDLDWQKILKFSSCLQIQWYFSPPSAPWWGGWWERLIGSMKSILRKVLGKACLTYEALNTILCDTEAIINSRPLTYLSEDPDDLVPITPSCFLQENREIGVPDCDMLYHEKLNKKFKHRQRLITDLRRRFRVEYLGQLIAKNNKDKSNYTLGIGDVVLIGDDNHKRIEWPLARVVEAHTGRDGKSRVFTLKTKSGMIKRALQRIYPLEIGCKQSEISNYLIDQASKIKKLRLKTKKLTKKDVHVVGSAESAITKNIENKQLNEKSNVDTSIVTTRSGRISKKPDRFVL